MNWKLIEERDVVYNNFKQFIVKSHAVVIKYAVEEDGFCIS